METKKPERGITIEIPRRIHEQLDDAFEWSPMRKKEIVIQCLEWICQQPQDLQGAIIGALPQSRTAEFAQMILEKMANEPQEDDNAPEPLQLPKTQPTSQRKAARKKSKSK